MKNILDKRILKSRSSCLWRLKRMRELDAPLNVLRTEQMYLWAVRQWFKTGTRVAPFDIPGFQANYQKFVLIHHADTKFPS
jgi:hypothetical protein